MAKTELIKVMDIKKGHEEIKYDPTDPVDLERIKNLIKEKLKNGFYLYGATKGGEYEAVHDVSKITDSDLTRFCLSKEMKKRLISVPATSG